jgi:hypothetical protein
MTGVEILNTEIVYVSEFNGTPFWVCLIAGLILGFIWVGFDGGCFDIAEALFGAFALGLAGLFVGCLFTLLTIKSTDEIDYIKHDVIISDEVNFNEFTEQYEIIEQNGKIYTVKERGN